jgi:hypothetical protein
MSLASSAVFSEIRASPHPARTLHYAVRAGKVPADGLPEIVTTIWTWDDSPTTGHTAADWLEVFRLAGFFAYPPLVVPQPDGSRVPLQRPNRQVILYRGCKEDRLRRMSWAFKPDMAAQLGKRHVPYGKAALYRGVAEPDAVPAYPERRDEGWTVVIDPAGLTTIERLRDIPAAG